MTSILWAFYQNRIITENFLLIKFFPNLFGKSFLKNLLKNFKKSFDKNFFLIYNKQVNRR